ncbi:hypothetical protein EON80_28215, partial [bacterium]
MKFLPFFGLLLLLGGCTGQRKMAELETATLKLYEVSPVHKKIGVIAKTATLTPLDGGRYTAIIHLSDGSTDTVTVV